MNNTTIRELEQIRQNTLRFRAIARDASLLRTQLLTLAQQVQAQQAHREMLLAWKGVRQWQ